MSAHCVNRVQVLSCSCRKTSPDQRIRSKNARFRKGWATLAALNTFYSRCPLQRLNASVEAFHAKEAENQRELAAAREELAAAQKSACYPAVFHQLTARSEVQRAHSEILSSGEAMEKERTALHNDIAKLQEQIAEREAVRRPSPSSESHLFPPSLLHGSLHPPGRRGSRNANSCKSTWSAQKKPTRICSAACLPVGRLAFCG